MTLKNGQMIEVELVVIGIGVKPQTDVAERAGIKAGNGVLVNQYLETSVPQIFARRRPCTLARCADGRQDSRGGLGSAGSPDHVIVRNERHLLRMLSSYADYYHRSRTHLSLAKDCPEPRPVMPCGVGKVTAVPQVGGLHHRYERLAAGLIGTRSLLCTIMVSVRALVPHS